MKRIPLLLFFLGTIQAVLATEQEPDILYYQGKKLDLETGWGHPSPLQTYYSQKDIEYPFQWHGTNNYRGHIATWKIDDGRFFITQINIEDKKYSPMQYQVVSKNKSLTNKDRVFADWFSGVLVCSRTKKKSWKTLETYYFHIKNGELLEVVILDHSEKKQNQDLTENTSDYDLKKNRMLLLNENYITYYYRLNAKDSIKINGKLGYLNRRKEGSPLLNYFSNDHLKWPFNWENFERSGAPNCKWTIRNDSIFLQEIGLLSNLSFNSVDKTPVSINDIFPQQDSRNGIFVPWLSGVFMVEYGKEVEDKNLSGYKEFKPTEFVFYRITNGKVTEKQSVLSGFNFRKIPKGTPKELKKLIEDYRKSP